MLLVPDLKFNQSEFSAKDPPLTSPYKKMTESKKKCTTGLYQGVGPGMIILDPDLFSQHAEDDDSIRSNSTDRKLNDISSH